MDTYQEQRSPEDIERDIERTRQEMAGTLDHLQKHLSPGQLIDQALGYLEAQSGPIGTDIVATLRANPVPATLAGAGLAWLLAMGLSRSAQSEPSSPKEANAPDYSLGEKAFVERRLGMDRRMNGSGGQSWHGHRAVAGTDMENSTSFPIERRRSERRSPAASAQMQQYAQEAETWTRRLVEEQPLLLGAFGLALGALLGAGLPTPRMTTRTAHTPTASHTKTSTWRGPEPTASKNSMHETPFFAERAHGSSDISIT